MPKICDYAMLRQDLNKKSEIREITFLRIIKILFLRFLKMFFFSDSLLFLHILPQPAVYLVANFGHHPLNMEYGIQFIFMYFFIIQHVFFLHIFRGRKMNAGLEKAIQEAMMELDRMTDD